jgi:hypothetical protein
MHSTIEKTGCPDIMRFFISPRGKNMGLDKILKIWIIDQISADESSTYLQYLVLN